MVAKWGVALKFATGRRVLSGVLPLLRTSCCTLLHWTQATTTPKSQRMHDGYSVAIRGRTTVSLGLSENLLRFRRAGSPQSRTSTALLGHNPARVGQGQVFRLFVVGRQIKKGAKYRMAQRLSQVKCVEALTRQRSRTRAIYPPICQ